MLLESGNRYVAFFDLLGFKSWIDYAGSKKVFQYLKEYIFMTIKSSYPDAVVDKDGKVKTDYADIGFFNFSDSIVFYTKDDSYEVFKMFIHVTCFFMNCVICGQSKMIKGAIAYGEFYVDTDTNSHVGKALIDAYLLEEELNWLALGIHNTVENTEAYIKYIQNYSSLFKRPDIPLKNSDDLIWCINWADNTIVTHCYYNPYEALDTILERKEDELHGDSNIRELEKVKSRIKHTVDFLNLFHIDSNMNRSLSID